MDRNTHKYTSENNIPYRLLAVRGFDNLIAFEFILKFVDFHLFCF